MAAYEANVCVFAPTLFVTITIEQPEDPDERELSDIHLHPGGQGFWIARMLRHLGERPVLCGPAGGEAGRVLRCLMPDWDIDLDPVSIEDDSPCYIHDRRSGQRREVARDRPPELDRHEVDDLYGKVLERAIATGACVVSGKYPGDTVPVSLFHRLGADLEEAGVPVVGDLHGRELDAFLEGGSIELLKVSAEDLASDGLLESEDEEAVFEVIGALGRRGARGVVVSRAEHPALARFGSTLLRARPPRLEAVDTSGSGDSMTAALAAAMLRGLDPEATLRLACAAGAANVTRRGLGSASGDLVPELAKRVEVEEVGPVR